MKRLVSILFVAFAVLLSSSSLIFAAETSGVDSVAKSDFETRREVLMKVFELSRSEIVDLQARLAKSEKPTHETFAFVYDALTRNLESYLNLVDSRIKELSASSVTLESVRITADNFKQWRETVYDPSTRELFDFLILGQGDTIFSLVETRYSNVAADVERLRVSFPVSVMSELDTLLKEANLHLVDARLLRAKAKEVFLQNFSQRHSELANKLAKVTARESALLTASLADTVISPEVSPSALTIIDSLDMSSETVQSLTKRAIDEIAQTYKLFLQMRELVRSQ